MPIVAQLLQFVLLQLQVAWPELSCVHGKSARLVFIDMNVRLVAPKHSNRKQYKMMQTTQ